MGWDGLAEHLENHEIGDGGLRSRRDIMNEPLVGLLARQLKACMANAGSVGKQDSVVGRAAALPASGSGN